MYTCHFKGRKIKKSNKSVLIYRGKKSISTKKSMEKYILGQFVPL